MYSGPFTTHARTVQLIISIKSGMASPQFQVKFDDFFETIIWKEFSPRSEWQYKARQMKPKVSNTQD